MVPKAKISKGGKIVIPALLRKRLDLREGEEVTFDIQDDNIVIISPRHSLKKARQIINRYHPGDESLVEKLIASRREEARHE